MDELAKLIELAEEAHSEGEKFYDKGNASAGTRTRQKLQEIKALCQEIRLDIQRIKNEGE
jgi:hypothetical protein